MPRHSPKLPSAGLTAAWTLDDLPDPLAFRRAIAAAAERHLGLAREAREAAADAIRAILEAYVMDTQDEAAAVPVARAKERIGELRGTAAAFMQALAPPRTAAVREAESLIEEAVDHRSDLAFRKLIDLTAGFVSACDRALARLGELSGERHFAPGEAWARFVAALADVFEQATGRPPTASKDRDLAQPSPFLRFAHAIQSLLPHPFWRHPRVTRERAPAAEPSAAFGQAVAKALAARRAPAGSQKPRRPRK